MEKELIEQNTILLTLAGSWSYGTNIETSDKDYRGICLIPDKRLFFGFDKFEQKDKGWNEGEDKIVYHLPFAISLFLQGNPNSLELLFSDDSSLLKITDEGRLLRNNKYLFLSKKVKNKYLGYAISQMKSLEAKKRWSLTVQEAPERAAFTHRKTILVGPMGHTFSETSKLVEINRTWEEASGKWMEVTVENFDKGSYEKAKLDYNNFKTWRQNRNPVRKEMEDKHGRDGKFSLHLVRLLRQCYEILTEGVLRVKRPDAAELLAIRNGEKYSYEELVEYVKEMEEKIEQAYEKSSLPELPNFGRVEQLQMEIIENSLRKAGQL